MTRKSDLPDVNFFYLVMRSTYREIPLFLQLAKDHGIERVAFQMLLVDERNLGREPGLADEVNFDPREVRELYDLSRDTLEGSRPQFKNISVCGFHSLFEAHNLECSFLDEGRHSFYPDNEADSSRIDIGQAVPVDFRSCPNPWTLMYVTESGAVHICFMATPVGNLYETPLTSLWNSPKALAARNAILNGQYGGAGCSRLWCSWREGKKGEQSNSIAIPDLIKEFKRLSGNAVRAPESGSSSTDSSKVPASIRRLLTERTQRIAELEWNFATLCEKNQEMLETAGGQNQALARRVSELERVLHFRSGEDVQLASDPRLGKSFLSQFVKKSAIGVAIRLIQAFDWTSTKLKRLVNRICIK
jgi:hypothetical protein